jgi:Tfp pilus assembly protein PilN
MKTGLVAVLSFLALALGGLLLVSTLTNSSLDALILTRDLGLSLAAVSMGVATPFLHRKFASDEEKDKAANN